MPDLDLPLRRAVSATVETAPPAFSLVYSRSAVRTRWRWSAVGLAGALTAVLTVVVLQPVPPPDFHRQVTAFVEQVYRD